MIMKINRSEWDILYDLLYFLGLNRDVGPTRLANATGLWGSEKKKYLLSLRDKGYMTIDTEDYGARTLYSCNATAKGVELRDKIMRIYELFGGKRPIW
jgi:predicted transcriptional regulator